MPQPRQLSAKPRVLALQVHARLLDAHGEHVLEARAARGDLLGVAPSAIAASSYGWVQVKGVCNVQVAASCAANVRLNTTATAGQLDDDGTAGSLTCDGIVLTTARAASAGTAPAVMNYSIQGVTI